MLALFCLRLASGLLASLLLLRPAEVNPRFFRVQLLTALALIVGATFFVRSGADLFLWLALGAGMGLSFLGSLVWSLDRAPGGLFFILGATASSVTALIQASFQVFPEPRPQRCRRPVTSGLLLGMATSAMLMGHSYLIAPACRFAAAGPDGGLFVALACVGWSAAGAVV